MAGFTDAPFRLLCREAGALWAVTEMVSSLGIIHSGRRSFQVGEPYPGEPDLVIQLFGSDPAAMGEAGARLVEELHPAALDINMGCPVPKVVKGGGGSCLLRTPQLAHDVTAALVRAVAVPVSVKVRLGWDSFSVIEVAQALETAGASCLAVHGRTRQQGYSGEADWDKIAAVAGSVTIPVIGSGDVTGMAGFAARRPLVSGVMIARGAMGRPWVFSEVRGEPARSQNEIVRGVWRHALLNAAWYGESRGMRALRGQLGHYFKGFEGASAIRNQVTRVNTLAELLAVLSVNFPRVALNDVTADGLLAGRRAA